MESNGTAKALTSIRHKFSQLPEPEEQTQPYIYKVHNHLSNVNNKAVKAYEPQIIAIGPYHHGKDTLKTMEAHKLRYLNELLRRRKEDVDKYVLAVGEMEQEARNCYAEPISLNEANFIEMLVLDGCFIIELTRKCKEKDSTCENDPIFQTNWIIPSLQRDLMLFENQIPFFVLCKLFDLIEVPDKHDRLIYFVSNFFQSLYPHAVRENMTNGSPQNVKHLLDLIHRNWRPQSLSVTFNVDKEASPPKRESRFIHSATELTDAHVKFQKKTSDPDDPKSLFDVEFTNDKMLMPGKMLMPPLTIEDRTECFFRNLIAYEQYFPNPQSNFVTDYVRLLDCLINSARDVEILSQCEIIDNWLGDNEVVARIFNQLTDSVILGDHFVYAEKFERINSHHKKPWNRAMAVLNRDYFASPWSKISVLAAFVLLLLTVAQTVFSVLQVV